jgi:hypothetical protein
MEMVNLTLQLLYPETFSLFSSPEASTASAAPFSFGVNKALNEFLFLSFDRNLVSLELP